MGLRGRHLVTALVCAGLLLVGCSEGTAVPSPPSDDAAAIIERALGAKAANRLEAFATLVSAASAACADAEASRRLGQLAVIAGRWASAVEAGRPKQQAVAEAQLAEVDWKALASACDGA